MNPVIVIPSYWAESDRPVGVGEADVYDHVTPVNKPVPELETCLSSLDKVRGVLRGIVLLVAPPAWEKSARARVEGICRMHTGLNPLIVGSREARVIARAVDRLAPTVPDGAITLRGYGAIRNMGLAVAATLGHDVVVFLDDDEVALSDTFLIDAVYGLGLKNRQGLSIIAKTGYFLDRDDSPYADVKDPAWEDALWSKRHEFNEFMEAKLSGTRISRSNYICGGCFAVSAEAFTRVAFDPVITRGEDLDYLFNLRMNGIDVWFDSQWYVRHMPPEIEDSASRFQQDVYRWLYEVKKLELSNQTIGLRRVTADSLVPYPGLWVSPEVERRIRQTAFRRALVGPEHGTYLRMLLKGIPEARAWAEASSARYQAFQTFWQGIIETLWDTKALANMILATGEVEALGKMRLPEIESEDRLAGLEEPPSSTGGVS